MLQGKIRVRRVGVGIFWLDKWIWYPIGAPFVVLLMKPDIVHGILETFAGFALLLCKIFSKIFFLKTKTILTLQTTNRKFLKGHIIRSADRVTEISKHLAGIAEYLGRGNTIVIPNGIDYDGIRKACEKYKKVPGRILFVGRLEHMKGVDLLLEAFKRVKSKNCKLHIVGKGSLREELEQRANKLGILNRVVFRGHLLGKDVYQEYAEAEIFCGLSRSEALGNVFIEAMAGGCALIFTKLEGILQSPTHGSRLRRPQANWQRVGRGVAYDSSNELKTIRKAANEISWFLSNKAQIPRYGFNGIQIAKEYDWKRIANQYAQIYKSFTLDKS
jgi:glycosyltransferase involved in cell wall biosynthesis